MKRALWCLMTAMFFEARGPAQGAAPKLTAPETKKFEYRQVYESFKRTYTGTAIINLGVKTLPEYEMRAEDVLAEQERAYHLGEFDEWLKTWNEPSQAKWRERLQQQGMTVAQWSADKKAKYKTLPALRLSSWVARRPYILITYQALLPGPAANTLRVGVFRLDGKGYWKATLDLEQDAVVQALLAGKTEVIEDLPK